MKKFFAVILSVILIIGILPLGVVADSNDDWKEYLVEELREVETGTIDVSKYNVTFDEVLTFLNYDIYYSYPEISYYFYWIENAKYKYNSEYAGTFNFIYYYDVEDIKVMQNQVEEIVDSVLKNVDNEWNDLQKALYIHDWLCQHYMYDLRLYDENEYEYINSDLYSFITEGRGVCQAYAFTYMYLLRRCSIESRYVVSDEANHGWNIVNIDGKWYHIDVTHDDPIANYDGDTDFLGLTAHDHFLLSDSQLQETCVMHINWYEPLSEVYSDMDYSAVDTCEEYKGNAYWKGIKTPFINVEKDWYYVDYNMGGLVKTRDFTDKQRIVEIGCEYDGKYYWMLEDGSGVPAYFVGLYEMNGHIFFNDNLNVYSYDTHFGKLNTVCSLDEKGKDRIYGMSINGNTIDYITDIDCEMEGLLEHFYQLGNHLFISDWFVTKEATDTDDGEQVKMCYICGEVVERQIIPALGADENYGDADGDGEVTTKDLAVMKLFLVGGGTGGLSELADVNRDGAVDTKDLATLKLFLAGAVKL